MEIKYSLLALKQPFCFPQFEITAHDNILVTNDIKALFKDEKDILHWKEWLGTLTWDDLKERDLFFITWVETQKSEALDEENQKLTDLAYGIYCAFLICDTFYTFGKEPLVLTGCGEIEQSDPNNIRLNDIRQITKFRSEQMPSYYRMKKYTDWVFTSNKSNVVDKIIKTANLINTKITDATITTYGRLILRLSIYSLHNAVTEQYRDFRIPNLVRSLETIIAIPPYGCKQSFSNRATHFLPNLEDLPFKYDTNKTNDYLRDIYQLRSDYLHGKPLSTFRDDDNELDYLIETICKNAIKYILQDPAFLKQSQTRAELEDNWKNNKFNFGANVNR